MAIVPWSPFTEIENVRRQMDKIFDEMRDFDTLDKASWKPAIELKDEQDCLI